MHPQQALDAPRVRLEEDGTVSVEPPLEGLVGTFGRPAAVVDDEGNFGNAHLITRDGGGRLAGGSEPRRDGHALGI